MAKRSPRQARSRALCARCEAWPERVVLAALHARRVRAADDAAVGGFVKPRFFSVGMWCDGPRTPGGGLGRPSRGMTRRFSPESCRGVTENDTRRVGLRELVGFSTQRSGRGYFRCPGKCGAERGASSLDPA